jgi:hypothetical protein
MSDRQEFFEKYEVLAEGVARAEVSILSRPAGLHVTDPSPIEEETNYFICNRQTGKTIEVGSGADEALLIKMMVIAAEEGLYIANAMGIEDGYPWLEIPDAVKPTAAELPAVPAHIYAQDPDTSAKMLAELAKDPSAVVRKAVAKNLATPPETLAELAIDEYPAIRDAALNNPSYQSSSLEARCKEAARAVVEINLEDEHAHLQTESR